MPKKKKPVKNFEEILDQNEEFKITVDLINKDKGETVLRSLNEEKPTFEGALSSGSLGLDWAINKTAGGMKWGQLLQLYGEKSGGKSTIALGFAANCTHLGKQVVYMDLEGSMDVGMVKNAGVDPELFYFLEEDGREAALIAERVMRAGNVGLLVIDSLAWWEPEVVAKKGSSSTDMVDFTSPKMAYQGSFITQVVKKLCRTARETGTVIISVNQVRNSLDMFSGLNIVPYGPKALDHAISVQCLVRGKPRGEKNIITDVDGELIGQYARILVDKNKTAIPMQQTCIPLILGVGVNPYMELATLAQEWGIVTGTAGNFKWVDSGEKICRGIAKFVQLLADDKELYSNLREKVIEMMGLEYHTDPVNAYDNKLCNKSSEFTLVKNE